MAKVKVPETSPIILVKYSKDDTAVPATETVLNITHNRDSKLIATLQTELVKLNYKYNAIFHGGYTSYAIIDKKYRFVDFSETFINCISRLTTKTMKIGVHLKDCLPDALIDSITANCLRAFKGEIVLIERQLDFEEGKKAWWLVEYSPAYNDKNRITGAALKVRDITDHKIIAV